MKLNRWVYDLMLQYFVMMNDNKPKIKEEYRI